MSKLIQEGAYQHQNMKDNFCIFSCKQWSNSRDLNNELQKQWSKCTKWGALSGSKLKKV